ncbi:general substrate transporter [Roridomyces roridus]|uniref:General substrate transporter n=1 Tax=Roridomyces roridus TaxID=1738132 RepID=A0AAD7FU41_9AGAR|nr:general substrate transporter [Roridomyces roridus]
MYPHHHRDRYKSASLFGSIVCTAIVLGTNRIPSSASWRLPFAIQFVPTTVFLVGVMFIPESPRWLMSVGRKEEARAILAKYHGNGDVNSPLVVLEFREMEAFIRDASHTRWADLFNSRSARYRTSIMGFMGLCVMFSGTTIFTYSTVAFDLAGAKTQTLRLAFTLIAAALAFIGNVVGAAIVDKVGRRPLWLWGTLGCSVTLALTAVFTSTAKSPAAIAFLLAASFVVNMTYGPLENLYPAECLSFENRSKGLALLSIIESTTAFIGYFSGAIAFQNIKWGYFLVLGAWDVCAAVVIWLFAVETKGRTLEEMTEIFEASGQVSLSS